MMSLVKIKNLVTKTTTIVGAWLISTQHASAQGIVPKCYPRANGVADMSVEPGGQYCQFEDALQLVSNVINFIFSMVVVIAAVMAVVVGIMYLTSGANASNRSKAKKMVTNFFLGLVIIMVAWFIVATILRVLGVDEAYSLLDL